MEIPFYPPPSCNSNHPDEWFQLDRFVAEVGKLLDLLAVPNTPFIIEERISGSKCEKNTLHVLIEQCKEAWDAEMFSAQYKDWFDMVKRQQELNEVWSNTSTIDESIHKAPTSLSELSEVIREAEIELSVAMASKDQLERVHKRIEALRADKAARHKVLAQIVFDVGWREMNDGVLVECPADYETIKFPKLSVPGVFGDQLILSGENLPVG